MQRKNLYEKGMVNQNHVLLEHVFRQLHSPLFFYAVKFVKDQDVAKDLVQDAFLGLLNRSEKEKIENLKSYLFRSVRNNCLNHLNHKKVENEFQQKEIEQSRKEITYYDSHSALVENELQQKLADAIDDLPEHYRIPFILSRFEDLKNKEIADKLQLPLRTVETQIYRALTILRKKFSDQSFSLFVLFFSKKKIK
jgi:RNA polymerase sigma-70 factor, ECF subfamily